MTASLPPGVKVHLALGYIDMRKGIDGLAVPVQGVLRRFQASDERLAVRTVSISNEISRCFVPATGFGQLARNPFSIRMGGHA